MKKDRDSFFSQYGYTGYNMPNMYSNNQNQLLGYQMPDINSRLNKIEETLFNLEKRISILESNKIDKKVDNDFNFSNTMYMI